MEAAETPLSSPQHQPQGDPIEPDDDRISELPDCLLHHILSSIDTRTVIQTSSLSRRWRYVWNSLPVLNFNYDLYPDDVRYDNDWNHKARYFGHFVNRVLFDFILRRRRCTDLQIFSLFFSECECGYMLVDIQTWLQVVAVYNLVEFDLYAPGLDVEVPPSLFSCTSLTKLRLVIHGGTKLSFDDGTAANLPMLRTLHLQGVKISSKGTNTKDTFLRRCPVLETLVISNCYAGEVSYYNEKHLLHICSPQLKNLEIIDLNSYTVGCLIIAPKLVTFKCHYRLSCGYSFVDTSSLAKATILYNEPHWQGRHWAEIQDHSSDNQEATKSKDLIGFLNGINNVKSLMLSTRFFEVIKVPGCFEDELIQYWDLRSLRLIDVYLSRSHTSVIPYLLEKCPNVETLSIEMAKVKVKTGNKSWRPASQCPKLYHLKFLEIRNVFRCENYLELLQYFMKSATMLEKVHIFAFKEAEYEDQYRSIRNIARKKNKEKTFISVLKKFLLAYSTVEISFFEETEPDRR